VTFGELAVADDTMNVVTLHSFVLVRGGQAGQTLFIDKGNAGVA
jgi:hypothetical protein